MNANSQTSKSARRRARLVAKLRSQAVVASSGTAAANNQPTARTLRNRRRRQRQRAGFANASGPNRPYDITNDYLQSLRDPEFTQGVKVPDLTAVPTGTFALEYDTTLTSSADGTIAFGIKPNMSTFAVNISTSGSTAGTISYTTTSFGGAASAIAIYNQVRPVSGIVQAEFIGSTSNDSGMATYFWQPRENTMPASVVAAANRFASNTFPAKYGGKVLWRPQDNGDAEFDAVGDNKDVPLVGFVMSGLPASSPCIRVHSLFNFEGIPGQDVSNFVQAGPSPVNLDNMSKAFSWGQYLGDKIRPLLPYASAAMGIGGDIAKMYFGGGSSFANPLQLARQPRNRLSY